MQFGSNGGHGFCWMKREAGAWWPAFTADRCPAYPGYYIHIGARIAVKATVDQILVSQTVRDLVAGSGIEFQDYGRHALKGIPQTWHLYAVA
jgi:hypothetical protein